MIKLASRNQNKPTNILLIVGILFIAINLRPTLASVGPLIEDIRQATGLSNSLLGLLTTLPLIAFSVISTLTPLFTRRFGIAGTLLGAMGLLTIGITIRSMEWIPALYLGTLLSGIAIAFGNVLLPSLTKRNFESNAGLITSIYSSMITIGSGLGAGLSVPLAHKYGLGWRGSLNIWAIFSILAFIVWLPQLFRLKTAKPSGSYLAAMKKLSGSRAAWQVALYMGFQSLTFYVLLAWLPAILQSRGMDATYSGWMLSLAQVTGVLGSLTIPIIARKRKDQRSIVLFLGIVELIGLTGLLLPQFGLVALWVSLIGFVLGATFGLSLLFIVLRSKDETSTTELSGMSQSIGYFIAGTGPIIFGRLFDVTGSWTYPFILLFVITLFKLDMGMRVGKGSN